jgi:hypothetical protein
MKQTNDDDLLRALQMLTRRSRDSKNLMEGSRRLPKVLGVLQLWITRFTGEIPASYGIGDPQSMIVNGIFAMIPAASAIMALMYINSCNSRLAFILSLDNNTSSRLEACILYAIQQILKFQLETSSINLQNSQASYPSWSLPFQKHGILPTLGCG